MPNNKKCPSCGFKMIGGKYCPECKAELIDDERLIPAEDYEKQLVEKLTPQITSNVLTELERKNAQEKADEIERDRQARETEKQADNTASDSTKGDRASSGASRLRSRLFSKFKK